MSSGLKIAVSGKGGVGKTTLCAAWARLFASDGSAVLALDADSDPNLATALGCSADYIPEPLVEMKGLIEERTGAKPGSIGQYFKMNPNVSDLPDKYSHEINGVKLLILGSIEKAGSGCACPEGAFLKSLLTYTVLHREEIILVDLAAGLEFMGRACVKGVDGLVVVVEPGMRSIETALGVAKMADEMGISTVGVFVNKISDPAQVEEIRTHLNGLEVLGSFGYDLAVQNADFKGKSVMDAGSELIESMTKAKDRMVEILKNKQEA
jgi:CO dehydrogenase maturation factor